MPAHRLFIGGLTPHTTMQVLQPIFEQHGAIQHINLVPDTQNASLCRGYAFVDYVDPNSANVAVATLNGQQFNGGMLKVQYSNVGARSATNAPPLLTPALLLGSTSAAPHASVGYDAEAALAAALAMTNAPPLASTSGVPIIGRPPMPLMPSLAYPSQPPPLISMQAPPSSIVPTSRVVVLINMVPVEELDDDQMYSELVQEISVECRKFGTLLSTVVPKEGGGRGKVYLQYEQMDHTAVAYRCLKGRKFGDAVVECDFYSEEKFGAGTYE